MGNVVKRGAVMTSAEIEEYLNEFQARTANDAIDTDLVEVSTYIHYILPFLLLPSVSRKQEPTNIEYVEYDNFSQFDMGETDALDEKSSSGKFGLSCQAGGLSSSGNFGFSRQANGGLSGIAARGLLGASARGFSGVSARGRLSGVKTRGRLSGVNTRGRLSGVKARGKLSQQGLPRGKSNLQKSTSQDKSLNDENDEFEEVTISLTCVFWILICKSSLICSRNAKKSHWCKRNVCCSCYKIISFV